MRFKSFTMTPDRIVSNGRICQICKKRATKKVFKVETGTPPNWQQQLANLQLKILTNYTRFLNHWSYFTKNSVLRKSWDTILRIFTAKFWVCSHILIKYCVYKVIYDIMSGSCLHFINVFWHFINVFWFVSVCLCETW